MRKDLHQIYSTRNFGVGFVKMTGIIYHNIEGIWPEWRHMYLLIVWGWFIRTDDILWVYKVETKRTRMWRERKKKRMKYYTFLFCRTSFWPRKVSISSSSSDFHWTSHSPSFNPRHFHFFLFFLPACFFRLGQIYRFFIPNDMSDIVKWMLLDCNTKKYS